jgi:hypothetical protein
MAIPIAAAVQVLLSERLRIRDQADRQPSVPGDAAADDSPPEHG